MYVRFEVLMAVSIMITVVWDMMICPPPHPPA